MHCGQSYIHVDDSKGLVQDSSFFFISAICKGNVMKRPNVGRRRKLTLRLKKMDEMLRSDFDDKRCTLSCPQIELKSSWTSVSSPFNCNDTKNYYTDQASCLMEDGISTAQHNSPPKTDGSFSNEGCMENRSDDCKSGKECIENDDLVFNSLTLKEIQNMRRSRQRSASLPKPSKTSRLNRQSNCRKRSHAHREPSEDESDLEETLGSWRSKLSTRRLNTKKRGLVASQIICSSSASEVPVRIKQENDTILSCVNSELADLDRMADIAACSFAGCDQGFMSPISTVSESRNVEDMAGALEVKNEEPDSSVCLSAITDCQNKNDFDYEPSKGRIQNDGSCSAPERTLQDNGALDRICPHSGNCSCHVKGPYTLPITDKVDHPESLGHVSPICVTNRMPLEVPSNEVFSGSSGTISGNVCSPESSQSSFLMQKKTSSPVVNDVMIQTHAADADDALECLGEFASADNTLNSVDISNGISSTEYVSNLDILGFNSELRITSFESKANEGLDAIIIKDCPEQNIRRITVSESEGESPARFNADSFNPVKDKFNDAGNKFLISKVPDVQSTTGNGNFDNPPHSQLSDDLDCSFKFVAADGSFNNDEGNESPTKLLADKVEAEEYRLDISSEVPTPEFIQTKSASGTGNFEASSHSLPDCSKGYLEVVESRSRVVGDSSSAILDTSSGYYPHLEESLATRVLSDMSVKRAPKKLFVKRKAISPTSQEKLCQAMDGEEMYKRLKIANRRQFDKWIKSGTASPGVGFEEVEDTAELVSGNVTSIPPTGCIVSSSNHDGHLVLAQKSSSPLAKKGILKASCGPCIVSCSCHECASIRSYAQKSIEFSQRQMRDINSLATNLVRELKSLTNVIEENLLSETCLSTPRYSVDEVKTATTNAAGVEETTRRWLCMMSKDCSRFCKIMKVKEKMPVKVSGLQKEQKKITFADEAGGLLCHVKVFGDHSDSTSLLEKDRGC